jgi:hypothetical protein
LATAAHRTDSAPGPQPPPAVAAVVPAMTLSVMTLKDSNVVKRK